MLPVHSRPLPTRLCLYRAVWLHRYPRELKSSQNRRFAASAATAATAAPSVSHKHNVFAGPGDSGDRKNRPDEYELRVGFAIATLQDDLPQFFSKGLTEHSIYAPNIVLSDPHYTKISVHGHTVYLGIAETLRWSLRMYFDDILFEITRLRVLPEKSPLDENKGIVRHLEVRWRLQGTRHPPLVFGRILGLYTSGAVQHYEGDFLYTFDNEGRIGEHRIQRIVPPPSRRILWMHSLGGRLRAYWEEAKQRRIPELTPASVKV